MKSKKEGLLHQQLSQKEQKDGNWKIPESRLFAVRCYIAKLAYMLEKTEK
ncbi:MAG TPA: hypothetical protein GX504_06215 [Clostridia bacterium]|nr:hypothetical protein [Clostridia bacterium]